MPAAIATLTLGLLAGFRLARRGRRRRLNECLHELRRPLQALALASPAEAQQLWLGRTSAALESLDGAINGNAAGGPAARPAPALDLAAEAAERWSAIADIQLDRPSGELLAAGQVEPAPLAAALDNLIANGLEHGTGPVSLSATATESGVRLEVANGPSQRPAAPRAAAGRRGHGLRLARRAARAQGGRLLAPRVLDGRVTAAIQLPGADGR